MLDATQIMVKNKLGLNYDQVKAYKIIYDFIGRFAFCQSDSNNIYAKEISLHDIKLEYKSKLNAIPHATRRILEKIGTESIHLFFCPHAYPKKFEDFCKKLLAQRAQMRDYYVPGLICVHKSAVVEVEYEE